MAMSGFICHDDYLQKTAKLTDEEVGRLFRALMHYHATGVADEVDGRESIAFDFIREDIDRTEAAYKAKCEKNRNNRLSALSNVRQQPSTFVNDCAQKEKEKEKEKEKNKDKETAERFETFWATYPRHVNRKGAEKAFCKLNPNDALLRTIIAAIDRQKRTAQWQENGGQFIPHPATWLNGRRWEDELPAGKGGAIKAVVAQDYTQRDYDDEQEDPDTMIRRLTAEMQM